MAAFFRILAVLTLLPLLSRAAPRDALLLGSSLSVDEHQTDVLRSPDGTFSCGFYSIYDNAFTFSIWYANSADKTVVWTANRDRPVHARGAALTMRKGGAMALTDYDGAVAWQAEGDPGGAGGALLDTGNLVMKNSSGGVVWQSFDSPTDTLLPAQRMTAATKLVSTTGLHVPGHYIFHFTDSSILSLIYDDVDVHEIYWPDPDNGEYQNNRNRYNSTRLAGLDDAGRFFSSDFADNQVASDEGRGIKRRLTLDPDGNLRLYSLNDSDGSWSVSWIAVSQPCNVHGLCGPNGICHYLPTPTCSCPPGYEMANPGNWSQGCRARVDIVCTAEQAQQPVKFLRLPGTDFWGSDQQHVGPVSLEACKNICRSDCTCRGFQYQQGSGTCYPKAFLYNGKAYTAPTKSTPMMYLKLPAELNTSGVSIPQTNVLISRKQHPDCGQMSASTVEPFPDVHKASEWEAKWFYLYGFAGAIFVLEVFFIASAWCFVLRWELGASASDMKALEEGYRAMTSNFRRYSYKELVKATKKFRDELGRGGSGIVYKGILDDSRAVAVKMLENVRQCEEEFQAELRIIGGINHMNLVRIWGFCSESSHRMLVTEYIEKGSLANILFNDNILLDWRQRFNIALGVAKGLAYLHHECLEWVIHCDVKPENILLDQNLEPKIADFGLAKLLNRGGSNQNVSRVRGTIGYIAPEWISSLQITAKVDVYSYGVVLLELVLGKRVLDLAVGADEEVHKVLKTLVGMLAHMLEKEDSSSIAEVVDCRLNGQFNDMQVQTLIKLAVSCLDEDRSKRPTMESTLQMLLLADESCS
ncbi:hypothetical protein U9M48_034442, partial [Paspalum notatum var. saurae]